MKTDPEIISAVLAGNARLYSGIVDRYKDRSFTLAYRLLGNREEAEESVQDAFVRAFRSLKDFRNDSQFGTWFYRILYNVCMTKVTRRRAAMESLDDPESSESLAAEPDGISALDAVADGERRAILNAELQNLPEKYRAVLVLFYVQDQKYEEIAGILNVSIGTVKTHLFRARTALRLRMMKRCEDEMRAA
jgi:RNA polymerase sigma factor (sigma-70 family)